MRPLANMTPTLPENGISTPSQLDEYGVDKQKLTVIAQVESIRNALKKEARPRSGDLDRIVAPWFDAGLRAHPKAASYAEDAFVDDTYVSAMRSGKAPVALRHFVPFIKHPHALIAALTPMCSEAGLEIIPRRRLTKDDLLVDLLRFMLESGPLLKLFANEVARRRGVEADDVMRALEG